MELAVIILNWNAAADTIRCARAVASWRRIEPGIWVVDNGSGDDSAQVIARDCPQVQLICNPSNLGFAGGNNRGIASALALGDAPILLLNNDAFVAEGDVMRLLDTLRADERVGFVGPLLFDAQRPDRLLSAGGRNPVLHHHSHLTTWPAHETLRNVEYVPGTVIVGRAGVFRRVGLLDEDYFFTMEVADLCKRAGQAGYLSVVDARARATHALGRSSEFRDTLYVYYIIRNRFLFIRKFYRGARPWLYGVWSLYNLALFLKVRLAGNRAMARAIWLGWLDGWRGRFGGQNDRVLSFCADAARSAALSRP